MYMNSRGYPSAIRFPCTAPWNWLKHCSIGDISPKESCAHCHGLTVNGPQLNTTWLSSNGHMGVVVRTLSKDAVCRAMFDVYGDVASGLKECLSNMGPWSLGDLTLGIRHVGKRHDKNDISDRLPGPNLEGSTSASTYAFLRREIKFAQAAYSIPDAAAIVVKAELPDADTVLHMSVETAKFRPAYMLIKDTEAKLIRVVVRGTNDLNDVLTDMAGVNVPMEGGTAHEGMLQAANWLLDETVPLLEQLPRADIAGCAAVHFLHNRIMPHCYRVSEVVHNLAAALKRSA